MLITNALGKQENVEIGDLVMMNWYGDSNVPTHLSYTNAVVIRITRRGSLVVKARQDNYGTRTLIPCRHVRMVWGPSETSK